MRNQPRNGIRGLANQSAHVAICTALVLGAGAPHQAQAYMSADRTFELHGFADSTTHQRMDYGLSKQRFRGQLEFSKYFDPVGPFSELSVHGTLRATYDGVYDFNDDDFGDEAGGSVYAESTGAAPVPLTFEPGNNSRYLDTPWGFSPVTGGNPALPGGGGFGFDLLTNPNAGLKRLGSELGNRSNNGQFGGGLEFFTPVRPCDEDPRGCIDDYLDRDEDDLRFPEFRDDHRWLREIYVDATVPLAGGDELNFRVGRQQVVWGRTDLFRVLDQINPIDYSIQNIYEEFEDSRIPLGIFSAEWRLGATDTFDDLNFQFIWNFEDFTPNDLGQGGTPYNILQAGDLFRALSTCWNYGCTVSNFATGLTPFGNLATDFPAHTIGIREAHVRNGNDQFGVRMEGVFRGVGFSVNALYFYQQNPSLRAGVPSVNPFLGALPPGVGTALFGEEPGTERPRPFVPAFDLYFPRVLLVGASADFYIDKVKSAFRVELAYSNGEEFADTSKPRLFSESDVIRWVVGWDRQTYIKFLNQHRTFLLSAQLFGQHLLDHERYKTGAPFAPDGTPLGGSMPSAPVGFVDWDNNVFATFLIQGYYMNDRVQPRLLSAYDVRAQAGVIGPQVDWLISDNWRLIFGANIKFGRSRNVADDGRTSNSFPPFSAGPACPTGTEPACMPGGEFSSVGIRNGFAPLGLFQSGPIGMAQHEDELQLLIRYRF